MKSRFIAAFALLAVTGCATQPPVDEIRLVARAFDNLNTASQPLLDELALAERSQGQSAALARADAHSKAPSNTLPTSPGSEPCPYIQILGGRMEGVPAVQDGFCREDSYYYSELADPPGTRAFRQALAAVGGYTQLLVVLAEGRNLDEASRQLAAITGNLGLALSAAGVSGAGPTLNLLLEAFNPLLDLAAKGANAKELQRLVVQESLHVERLVKEMGNQAGEFFTTLTEASMARFNLALDKPDVEAAEAARIEAYRVAVSNYVVLLDQYGSLLSELVRIYDQSGGALTLASLAERSAQLSAQADAWRRSLAALRAGLR
ncbi:MAG: hypothetical protein H6968_01785 [Chromatiaceae bacterium]|nr:hypothetical protein [Chromatiaceae bacterium]